MEGEHGDKCELTTSTFADVSSVSRVLFSHAPAISAEADIFVANFDGDGWGRRELAAELPRVEALAQAVVEALPRMREQTEQEVQQLNSHVRNVCERCGAHLKARSELRSLRARQQSQREVAFQIEREQAQKGELIALFLTRILNLFILFKDLSAERKVLLAEHQKRMRKLVAEAQPQPSALTSSV